MASSKLERAPVWVLIHNIPPQMYSYEGLSVIGSGIGDPLYTDHPLIESSPRSVAKIKICVVLDRKQPASICVKDKFGNSVRVRAEYPRLPPRCDLCSKFGHLPLRCPSTTSPHHPTHTAATHPRIPPPIVPQATSPIKPNLPPAPSIQSLGRIHRTKSLPSCAKVSPSSDSSSDGWTYVVKRTKHHTPPASTTSAVVSEQSLTSSLFRDEQESIRVGQIIIRARSTSTPPSNPSAPSAAARKKARRKLRALSLQLAETASPSAPKPNSSAILSSAYSG